MTKPITNKVTIKMYGEKAMSDQIVKHLTDLGFKPYGDVTKGNPYKTQKDEAGWASTVTFFRPDKKTDK